MGFGIMKPSSRAQASLHNQDVVGSNQSDHSRFVIKSINLLKMWPMQRLPGMCLSPFGTIFFELLVVEDVPDTTVYLVACYHWGREKAMQKSKGTKNSRNEWVLG